MTQEDHGWRTRSLSGWEGGRDQARPDAPALMVDPHRQRGERERANRATIHLRRQPAENDVTDDLLLGFCNERDGHQSVTPQPRHQLSLVIAAECGLEK